jgi:hypothetical protein
MHFLRISRLLTLVAAPFLLCLIAPDGMAQTKPISTFASDPAAREANYEIHANRRKSGGLDEYYRRVMEKTDPWNEIGSHFHSKQMDKYDLVDIVAYFWVHTYGVSTNLMPDGESQRNYNFKWNQSTWLAVRGQVQTMFDNENAMAGLSNSVRQRYADSVMLEIVFQQQALKLAMKNGKEDTAMRQGFIALNREMIGFDISKAALGSGGFYAPAGSNEKFPFLASTQASVPTAATRTQKLRAAPVAAGLSAIKGVFYESEVRMLYGASPEFNRSYVEEYVTVLFADGTACEGCHPAWTKGAADFSAFKAKEFEKFGTWKATGSVTTVTINGRTQNFKSADRHHGGSAGLKINAMLTTTGGRNSDNDHLGSTDYLQLLPSGRFNLLHDRAEQQTRPNYMGDYTVTGDYRIMLNYDDGYSETLSFAVSPNDPNFLIIDGTAYYVSKL